MGRWGCMIRCWGGGEGGFLNVCLYMEIARRLLGN